MALYQHKCGSCGYEFDKLMSIKAQTEVIQCPQCKQQTAARVITPVSVIFRGQGWYSTDNKKRHE